MKLGKLPARKGAIKLRLSDYLSPPTPPTKFSHENLISDWQMLGNDRYGDCVLAGAGHETMLWNKEASKTVGFSDSSVLSDYSAITGFNPADPNSDQGTDMQVAASYRLKTGVQDASGGRHKIAAYLAISPGNVAQIKAAVYMFSAVGIGIQFPDYAMDEFNAGQSWHLKTGGSIDGGHYIPAIGYDSRYLHVVTWGKLQRASWGFIKKYMDEGVVYLSAEFLSLGVSPEGFNLAQLQADLKQL